MKILVVDDEPSVLKLFNETLSSIEGLTVRSAVTGEKALEIAAEWGGLDLLFTDVVLPGIDGFSLRQQLAEMVGEFRTVFVSGYDLSSYSEYTQGHFLFQKPILPTQIEALVQSIRNPPVPAEAEPVPTEAEPVPVEVEPVPVEAEPVPVKVVATESELLKRTAADPRSRSANLRSLVQRQGFTGKLDQFQLVDIIQMCCLSRRTGRLQITKGIESGVLFLNHGDITHAVTGALVAEEAVYKIIGWDFGQFAFEDGLQADANSIHVGWEHLIMEGVRRRDETGEATKEVKDENLVGKTLGQYQIVRKIGEGEWGEMFEAIQTSMERPVALKVLWKDLGEDPAALQEFVAAASSKANVAHPYILSVYEAGEAEGRYFYARELVDGNNLKDLKAEGKSIDDITALSILRTVAEGLSYLSQNKIPHSDLTDESIFIGSDHRPRLANLASPSAELKTSPQEEIKILSKIVSGAMQGGVAAAPGLRMLLTKMIIDGSGGMPSYGALLQSVKAIEPKVIPQDAYKLTEKDQKAVMAVEQAKKRQKRALIISSASMMALVWVAIGFFYFQFLKPPTRKDFSAVVEIPAGEFQYQKDEIIKLPTFYIDQHEVTIAQYAEFLADLDKNPTTLYDHPDAPANASYRPSSWDVYYRAAQGEFYRRSTFRGAPIDINSPVMNLNWYAAQAYAKWRGGRLPTEQEWEKAARGTKGFRYPWGNEMINKGVNTSADYNNDGSQKGSVDGYNRWAPVDAMKRDISEFGVVGMAGNVSEWTSSKAENNSGDSVPVIRGGNYYSKDYVVSRRILELSEFGFTERVGLRVAYDTPPPNAKVIKP